MNDTAILIVEDEQIATMDIEGMVREAGYGVAATTDTGEDALEYLAEHPVGLVIMDISLPGEVDGIEVTEEINRKYSIPVVYLTAYSDDETLERARATKPAGFLVKPVTGADVKATLAMVLDDEGE